MRWPFVFRASYDAVCESRDVYKALYQNALHREEMLTDRVRPVVKPVKDEMVDVIDLKAGNDSALKRHLWFYVKQQRRAKVAESEIMDAVLHWQTDDEGVPA